jgi:hypothetical protein
MLLIQTSFEAMLWFRKSTIASFSIVVFAFSVSLSLKDSSASAKFSPAILPIRQISRCALTTAIDGD